MLSGAGVIDLPMIVNRKTVDPGDKGSTPVIQLETAMGAAIGVFEGAAALRVPRSRFVPVKTTNDLLSLRSDAYVIGEGRAVHLAPERDGVPPFVDLDRDHYKLVGDFDARFPAGPPSLVGCDALQVVGDVTFGADVVVRGDVTVQGVDACPTARVAGATAGASRLRPPAASTYGRTPSPAVTVSHGRASASRSPGLGRLRPPRRRCAPRAAAGARTR